MSERVPPGGEPPPSLHTFTTRGADGVDRHGHLVLPGAATEPVPVLLAPHPFGYDPIMTLFGHPAGARVLTALPGVWEPAVRRGLAVLSVQSEGRRYTGASLGWRPHLDAYGELVAQAAEAGLPVAPDRLVAAGLSMGGMEALLLGAVLHPRVHAVAGQNAVIDVAAWVDSLARVPGFEAACELIRTEVGDDAAMHERSPINHLDALRDVPIQLRYSAADHLVPATSQSMRLAGGSPCWSVVEDTPPPIDGVDLGVLAHEYVDWEALLDFVLARAPGLRAPAPEPR